MTGPEIIANIRTQSGGLVGDVAGIRSIFANLRKDVEQPMQIRVDTAGAAQALVNLRRQGQQTNFALRELSRDARNGLIAIGAAVGLAVREYAKHEQANEQLRSALRATGSEVEGNYARYDALAKSLRSVTTASDDSIKSLITLALNLGVSAEQAGEVAKAGIGLGKSFFGGDSERGTRAAALAIQGNTRELTRMIPALKSATSQQQVLDIVSRKAAVGLREAEDDTSTFSGSMAILARNVGDAQKVIGEAFAPDVQKAANIVSYFAEQVRTMDPANRKAVVSLTELGTAGLAGTYTLTKGLTIARAAAAALGVSLAGLATGAAITAGVGALAVAIFGEGDSFAEKFNDMLGKIEKGIGWVTGQLKVLWKDATEEIVQEWFRAKAAMFGGDADKEFQAYLAREMDAQEKATKAREDQLKKETNAKKDATDQQVKLTSEGVEKEKAQYMSVVDVYKRAQLAILNNSVADAISGGAAASTPAATGTDTAAAADPKVAAKAAAKAVSLANAQRRETVAIARINSLHDQQAYLRDKRSKLVSVGSDNGLEYSSDPDMVRRIDEQRKPIPGQIADAEEARRKAIVDQRAITGENPLRDGDPAKLSVKMVEAQKKINSVNKQIANIDKAMDKIEPGIPKDTGYLTRSTIDESLKDAREKQAKTIPGTSEAVAADNSVRRMEQLQELYSDKRIAEKSIEASRGVIARSGRDKPERPWDRDSLGTMKAEAEDRISQSQANRVAMGPNNRNQRYAIDYESKYRDQMAEYNARFNRSGAKTPTVETPDNKMSQQFGANVQKFGESAEKLGKAADAFIEGAKNYKRPGRI